MGMRLAPFDPRTATREEWERFHSFRRKRHAERDPDDPLIGDDAAEALMRREDPMGISLRFAVLRVLRGKPEDQVGLLEFEMFRPGTPSYEPNKDSAFFGIEVVEAHRRKGIGTALLRHAAELARANDKTLLATWSEEDAGKAFLKTIHAPIAQARRENRLYLDRVDWDMVRRWAREGPLRSPDTELRWARDRIDDADVEEFARAFTEVFNDQPFDDFRLKDLVFRPSEIRDHEARIAEARGTILTAFTTEPDGRVSGLTDVWRYDDTKAMVGQGLTGVRKEFRGRGLGKWLKAAMLLRIREDFPEATFIGTGNASSNEAMLSINERLGFRTHKEPILAQMRLEAVEAYLASAEAKVRWEDAA
ncbi:MAG: GNAT family N-acetyltransferase [Methanobacteriota archaeon]